MKETGRSTQHCFPVNFLGFFFTVGKSLLQIDEGRERTVGKQLEIVGDEREQKRMKSKR